MEDSYAERERSPRAPDEYQDSYNEGHSTITDDRDHERQQYDQDQQAMKDREHEVREDTENAFTTATQNESAGASRSPRRTPARSPARSPQRQPEHGQHHHHSYANQERRSEREHDREMDRERDDHSDRGRGEFRDNPGNNVHVSGLHTNVDESALRDMFKEFGTVTHVEIVMDPHTKESRGFAFVTFDTVEGADAAIAGMNGVDQNGRRLIVQKARRARARTPTPGRYYGNKQYIESRRGGSIPRGVRGGRGSYGSSHGGGYYSDYSGYDRNGYQQPSRYDPYYDSRGYYSRYDDREYYDDRDYYGRGGYSNSGGRDYYQDDRRQPASSSRGSSQQYYDDRGYYDDRYRGYDSSRR
ncbi:hypothetical protein SeMB42_g04280 [Synchytrium endobioticum]|uniref:RRM domain-containing protein n=1 Tax=Synchytrium endobioticum TaxID=286115 RepID=A0A507CZJ8_9FUNG|nr:hypothetical protein SeMB42_g04280 [Synchytrium endobioticum]